MSYPDVGEPLRFFPSIGMVAASRYLCAQQADENARFLFFAWQKKSSRSPFLAGYIRNVPHTAPRSLGYQQQNSGVHASGGHLLAPCSGAKAHPWNPQPTRARLGRARRVGTPLWCSVVLLIRMMMMMMMMMMMTGSDVMPEVKKNPRSAHTVGSTRLSSFCIFFTFFRIS